MAPPPEHRILDGKYRLVRMLDEGGMGSVWFAEHLSLHSPVAVKLIAKEVADTEEGLQRFLREARTAASLRSPHVVQILDYGVDDGTPYIVMELLDGESLADRLARVVRLSPRETELILRHIGRAVGRAHDAGIVHRDLKPANIFVIENDDEQIVKLLDFGIAKATIDALSSSIASNTRTGAFLGTPFYVSPEQAEGVKSLDHRTDIWSMGVIAFECLIGEQPFKGETFGSLVLSICSRPIPVPSRRGRVPVGFDAWFARACAREPDRRFQTAREAAAELRVLVEQPLTEVAPLGAEGARALASDELSGDPVAKGSRDRGNPIDAYAATPPGSGAALSLGNTTAAASSSAVTERMAKKSHRRWRIASALGGVLVIAAGFALRAGSDDERPLDTARSAALPEPEPQRAAAEPSVVTPPTTAPPTPPELVAPKPASPNVSFVVADPPRKSAPPAAGAANGTKVADSPATARNGAITATERAGNVPSRPPARDTRKPPPPAAKSAAPAMPHASTAPTPPTPPASSPATATPAPTEPAAPKPATSKTTKKVDLGI